MDIPEHPVIRNLERTGYPSGRTPEYPRCPICGTECDIVYRNKNHKVVGCYDCLSIDDAWEAPECFPEGE